MRSGLVRSGLILSVSGILLLLGSALPFVRDAGGPTLAAACGGTDLRHLPLTRAFSPGLLTGGHVAMFADRAAAAPSDRVNRE